MTLYKPKNRISNTLAIDFSHGTDNSLTLSDASKFPPSGGYILIDDRTEWAIYEYTGISTNTLNGLSQAHEINESTPSHIFNSGTTDVYLTQSADILADIVDLLQGNTAFSDSLNMGGNLITNLLGIADSDNDTQVTVEKNKDEDIIRFYVNGSEALNID